MFAGSPHYDDMHNHGHHHGHWRRTLLSSGLFRLAVAAALLVSVVYFLSAHNNVRQQLRERDTQHAKCRQQHDALSAQLQVVYEHKSRLEQNVREAQSELAKSKKEMADQLVELQKTVDEQNTARSTMEDDLKTLRRQMENLTAEKEASSNKVSENINKLSDDLQREQQTSNKLREQVSTFEKSNADLNSQVAGLQESATQCEQQLREARAGDAAAGKGPPARADVAPADSGELQHKQASPETDKPVDLHHPQEQAEEHAEAAASSTKAPDEAPPFDGRHPNLGDILKPDAGRKEEAEADTPVPQVPKPDLRGVAPVEANASNAATTTRQEEADEEGPVDVEQQRVLGADDDGQKVVFDRGDVGAGQRALRPPPHDDDTDNDAAEDAEHGGFDGKGWGHGNDKDSGGRKWRKDDY